MCLYIYLYTEKERKLLWFAMRHVLYLGNKKIREETRHVLYMRRERRTESFAFIEVYTATPIGL